MQYRDDKYGNKLSILGYGCMRFTKKGNSIDIAKAEKEIMAAYKAGVNYFDTAYIYPGSEEAIGEIFERNHIREKINIATKLPQYMVGSRKQLDKYFNEELTRLRTTYIDYYLMHHVTDVAMWEKLKKVGIVDWIAEKKASGEIRNIGFSYHGNTDMFCTILDAYDWDFCQIQYNYLDEHAQAGRRGLQYAYEKGIPVIIMEPLRGGRLVKYLPAAAREIFERHSVKRSPAEWGLRWLWNQKEVTVVLSGMNSDAMVRENIRVACQVEIGEQGQREDALYAAVVKAINENVKVGCTACGYCMPCPKGVDIPGTFAIYNRWYGEDKAGAFKEYLKCTTLRKNATAASNCIGCGKCEKHCPQGIEIRKQLKEARKALETPLYKICRKVVGWFAHF
jgi:predicted aldo/keto reductase-like oxidoreductase